MTYLSILVIIQYFTLMTLLFLELIELAKAQLKVDNSIERSDVWFKANNLFVNNKQSENLIFSLKSPCIENKSVKILGMVLHNKLDWGPHTESVIKRISRVLFLLRRLKLSVGHDMLVMAYFAFFHAHLIYGIRLWGNSPGATSLFMSKKKKKTIRIIQGLTGKGSCREHFKILNVMTVPCLYIYTNLVYVKENLDHFIQRTEIHNYMTRNNTKISLPSFRLSKCIDSHLYIQFKFFNRLPECAKM